MIYVVSSAGGTCALNYAGTNTDFDSLSAACTQMGGYIEENIKVQEKGAGFWWDAWITKYKTAEDAKAQKNGERIMSAQNEREATVVNWPCKITIKADYGEITIRGIPEYCNRLALVLSKEV